MSKHKKKVVAENVTPLQPGEKLRQAREARDLSVADVAVRLKLGAGKITALEQGKIEGFTAPVFVAGYLRTYARLLELPEAEVLADFELLLPAQESLIDSGLNTDDFPNGKVASEISSHFSLREKSSRSYLGMAGFAAVIVLGLGYFLWPTGDDVSTRVTDVAQTNVAMQQAAKRTLPASAETVATETESSEKISFTPLLEQDDSLPMDVAEPVEVEAADVPVATFEALAIGMKSELTLVFRDDSWVEVKDAREQRLVFRLGKAGSARTVTGVAPFVVQLGYVQGVDILYNGSAYDLSKYANRRSVRLLVGEAGDRMGGG